MLNYVFPSDAKKVFAGLYGASISGVKRQVLESDFIDLPPLLRDERSDGPLELVLDNGVTIHFIADTEHMSVKVCEEQMPSWGDYYKTIEPIENDFWSRRVGHPIIAVYILISIYADLNNRSEFAVELQLEGGIGIVVEYVSDDTQCDTLRVLGAKPSGNYLALKVV